MTQKINFFLIFFCFVFLTVNAQKKEIIIDQVVAVVGKNIVKLSDIENNYAQMRMQQGYNDAFNNRCNILESVLLQKLLMHKGNIDSVQIPDQYIDSEVEKRLKYMLKYYGSKETVERESGRKYEDIKEMYTQLMYENMMAQQVEEGIVANVKVTPREVSEYFNSIPKDSIPMLDAEYEISEIVLTPIVNESERDRVRLELNKLRERVLKGEKFSMLATLYSEDPGSAKKGGELGFFSRGEMVGEFEAAAFALKPGEVSPVIETKFGFHIIQLIERRGNMINARHILLTAKVSPEDLLKTRIRLDSIATLITAGSISFEDAARQYSDSQTKTEGGIVPNPNSGNNRFTKDVMKQVFPAINIERMAQGDISSVTPMKNELNQDAYRIIKLNRLIESHKANLADDYDKIYVIALQNAKNEKLLDWASKMIKNTYIKVNEEYKECNFKLNWLKK